MNGLSVLLSGVVLSQPMGGVRRHNQELLPRVAKLLAADGGSLTILEGRAGLAFELDSSIRRVRSSVPASPAIARAMVERAALEREIAAARSRGEPYDLVHTAHLPAPRELSLPYSLTLHDLRNLEPSASFARRLASERVVRRAVRDAAVVITVSETVGAALVQRFDLDPARAFVVPNAADHFEPLARTTRDDAPLLHVGHVEPRKNLELVIRALALDPRLPRFVAVGAEKDREAERLRKLAAELGVGARVQFEGAFEERELASLYAGAACVVLPSRVEGFGIAALEAARARVPLAVARAGALVEVAGANTPNFAPDDPAECARAIRAALAISHDELERAAERAARFRWDDSAARWLAAWNAAR